MAKERRCNLFDDNGKPRRLTNNTKGCPRDASDCLFAHPHERTWKTARPSYPPKHDSVADADSEFYYVLIHSDRHNRERKERDKERDRERDRDMHRKPNSSFRDSPPHRRDSATSHPSPGTSSRKSTFDSALDSANGIKRGWSPALSSASDQLERLRKDKRPHDPPSRPYPSSSRRSRSRSRDRDRRGGVPTKMPPAGSPVTDPRKPNVSAAQQSPTFAPEPSKPPPMQPPPPPPPLPEAPKVPSFVFDQPMASASTGVAKGSKELSLDEQRTVWHERIDLMFMSITSRRDYIKLESDLTQIRLLSNSSLVNNMSEADRSRIHKQKAELERQMEVKRKGISEGIQKLLGSNFWPILRTPQISEMEKTLDETKKHVLEVRSLLDDVKTSSAALFKTSVAEWTPDADRPSKRRRLDGDTPVESSSGNAELVAESTAKELEAFRDTLTELDRHLIDLENDITQRDRLVADEIELRIDSRLQDEHELYSPIREPGEIFEHEIEAVVNRKNQEIVSAVNKTGEDIEVLAVEVAELITKVNALEARCMTLEAENKEFKNKLAQDAFEHEKSQDALMRRDKEIDAIAAALKAYISQSTAGQATGDLPSAEYIIESLGSQLDSLFMEKFCPKLVDVQKEVYTKVEESNGRTLDTISPSITLLSRMVSLITARLGKPDTTDAMSAA